MHANIILSQKLNPLNLLNLQLIKKQQIIEFLNYKIIFGKCVQKINVLLNQ